MRPTAPTFRRLLSCGSIWLLLLSPSSAGDGPQILARQAWGAKPAIEARMSAQTPLEIVIHHTGVRKKAKLSLEKKLRGLQDYSLGAKRWGDVPYHFYIDAQGRIGEGRDLAFAGDTNTRYDVRNRIQLVVEGDFEQETPGDAQIVALRDLVEWLRAKYGIAGAKVVGHGDLAQTDCPGKSLKPFLAELRK
jgi:N-acetylmuramoyl-L-alanine amidase-like protein